jgi:asparagine synthase (glutamine-hydrolysing)
MAHGIEARVPFLDHPLVELAATIPSNIKFQNGELKRLLKIGFAEDLPTEILQRKDKMGFPVPLQVWMGARGRTYDFVRDLFSSQKARERPYLAEGFDANHLITKGSVFGRNLWGLLCLELWQQRFHDSHSEFS